MRELNELRTAQDRGVTERLETIERTLIMLLEQAREKYEALALSAPAYDHAAIANAKLPP